MTTINVKISEKELLVLDYVANMCDIELLDTKAKTKAWLSKLDMRTWKEFFKIINRFDNAMLREKRIQKNRKEFEYYNED